MFIRMSVLVKTFGALPLGIPLANSGSAIRRGTSCKQRPLDVFGSLSAEPKIKVLHLTWFAFFVSFIVWFNHAPLMASIRDTFALSKEQVAALLIDRKSVV